MNGPCTSFGRRAVGSTVVALASLGLTAVTAPAQSQIPFFVGELNQLSDNAAEYLINADGGDDTTLDVGDRLRGHFRIETVEDLSGGGGVVDVLNSAVELTAIFDVTVASKVATGGGTPFGPTYTFVFVPTPGGLSGTPGPAPPAGTMVRFYEDPAKDFTRLLSGGAMDDGDPGLTGADIGVGPFATEAAVATSATGGQNFWDLGFAGNPGEGWVAVAIDDILVARGINPPGNGGTINIGLSILANYIGPLVQKTNCPLGAPVDVCGSSNVLGIAGAETPYDVFNNVDFAISPVEANCCVDIEKEINVDGVWYDHDLCVDAPVVPAPHSGEYRLIVSNCGNTVLTSVQINDPTLGVVNVPIADLAPGETRTLTSGDIPALGTQEICDQAGEFDNIASVTADCAEGPVPSVSDEDSSCLVCTEEEIEQCRVTAGGNKDGLTIPCELKSNGMPDPTTCADKGPDTWGGQAGAPPRTDGNWTHHHKPDNKDTFVFHSNSLFDITCSDPGPICEPSSAPSPDRQIDFSGIGQFNNKHGVYAALPDGDLCFRVHLEDLGEPGPGGRRNDIDPTACTHCPGTVIGNDPDCENCTDYYMIRIYDSAAYDPDTHDCTGNLIYFNGAPSYDVCNQPGDPLLDGYYVRAGSVQMHTDNNGGSVGNEEICYDGIDNDGDGLIDAADPDCYSTETSCADGIDNDSDGLIDLADPDCQTCTPTAAKEHGNTCSDGFDNDCDGLIDAADPDC